MQEAGNEGGAEASAALSGKRVLLVIAGGIAAYKCLDLIRRLRESGAQVRCILTRAGAEFVTPLSVETLAGGTAFTDTLALTAESDIAHIRLGQEADIVVVAPATADIMAKMAHGIADDSGDIDAARRRQAGARGARDEHADVVSPRDGAQPRAAGSRRRALRRPQ